MKFSINNVLTLILVLPLIFSCSKDEENNPSEQTPNPKTSFTAKVSGNSFVGDTASAAFISGTDDFVILSVDGVSGISFYIRDFNGEGTYNFSNATLSAANYFPDTSIHDNYYSTFYGNGIGSLTIADFNMTDSTVGGSFSFTGQKLNSTETVEITEGSFSQLTTVTEAVQGIVNNTFSVTIDNTQLWEQSGGAVNGIVSNGILGISAVDISNQTYFTIELPQNVTPGTYTNNFSINYVDNLKFYTAISQSITVVTHDLSDGIIDATFSFQGSDFSGNTKSFTQGSLHVEYGN